MTIYKVESLCYLPLSTIKITAGNTNRDNKKKYFILILDKFHGKQQAKVREEMN